MTEVESEHEELYRVTDDLEILELFEPHRVFVSSPKRVEKIQIIKTNPQNSFYKILYESGKPIPELDGDYTSAELALSFVKGFLTNSKQTTRARAKERFGDKPVPELKTKPVKT